MKHIILLFSLILMLFTAATAEDTSGYQLVYKEKNVYTWGDTGYLMNYFGNFLDEKRIHTVASNFTSAIAMRPEVPSYVFLAPNSRCLDMDHLDQDPPLLAILEREYPPSQVLWLPVHDFETYKKYVYRTDHHWNAEGSYQGYRMIARAMLGENEPLMEPVEKVDIPLVANGSYNRYMDRKDGDTPFTVYRFDFPEMKVWIDGERRNGYGNQEAYLAGKYENGSMINHYARFYGGDEGLIKFDTNQPDKENLLIIANSLSNPVNMLLASHFNCTYVVDTRHFYHVKKVQFTLSRSIDEWKIDKVLMLGDGQFFSHEATFDPSQR